MKKMILIGVAFLFSAAAAVDEAKLGLDSVTNEALTATRVDTVYVVRENNLESIVHEVKGIRSRIEKSRKQGYGGAGGWTPLFMVADLKPVQELITKDKALLGKSFDIDRVTLMPGAGGMGYGGLGKGIRIGGGGFSGTSRFTSANWGLNGDSATSLNVDLSYGGFMLEKAFVNDKFNYIVGGLIGGGAYIVRKNDYKRDEPSAFDEENFSSNNKNQAEAAFTAFGLHAGATYSAVPWFHVGADASLLTFIGIDGFPNTTGSIFTGAGVFRLRLIWGSLG
ncbi:MAG: hypothetical protein JNL74_06000 [Fibrobacteres bacterium]|nr:hypothetical protein [Fibrobacterota bacterium]